MTLATEITVAALYVEKDGVYFGLPDVDPWDEERDARLYAGPHPVVAHPPCARWGQLANVNHARYGTPIGEDGGCFEAALAAVREFGDAVRDERQGDVVGHVCLLGRVSGAEPRQREYPRTTPSVEWSQSLERLCEPAQRAFVTAGGDASFEGFDGTEGTG